MKKLIASILTVLTVGASAQLTYVTTVNKSFSAPLSMGYNGPLIEGKTYFISESENFHWNTNSHEYYDILNSDFSLYKRISIYTTGWGDYDGDFYMIFSDHLYNSDDKVEIIYTKQKKEYYTNQNGQEDYKWVTDKTIVIDEDGIELQTIDNVSIEIEELFQLNGKTYFQNSKDGKVDIYEAAGTLPCKTCSSIESSSNKKAPEKAYDINVFPNPTTNQVTLAINTDKTGMKVHIYSTDGKLVKSANVINGNNLIDTADLVSGTYIYNVVTHDELIHASQFIKK